MSELVSDVTSFVGNRAEAKGIRFTTHLTDNLPAVIHSDPTRLRQILFNLIGNAIKFTDAGTVELKIAKTPENTLSFSVTDTGIGMSAEGLQRLFQPFTQAEEDTTRKYGGTGLGLAISKRLVELLSGVFQVTSAFGQGSCFTFSIPADNCKSSMEIKDVQGSCSAKPVDEKVKRLKILIAEDFEDNRLFFQFIFKKFGLTPSFALDGAEAVAKAQNAEFDIVFMDIQMPVLDGISATQQLISSGYKKPIIALTATTQENFQHTFSSTGFSGFLGKPFKKEALLEVLQRFC